MEVGMTDRDNGQLSLQQREDLLRSKMQSLRATISGLPRQEHLLFLLTGQMQQQQQQQMQQQQQQTLLEFEKIVQAEREAKEIADMNSRLAQADSQVKELVALASDHKALVVEIKDLPAISSYLEMIRELLSRRLAGR
jgi:hypothetical protein